MRWQRIFGDRIRRSPDTPHPGAPDAREQKSSEGAPCQRPTGGVFGVGAQVIVHLNRSAGEWPPQEDPVGVIVAPGEELGTLYWAPPSTQEHSWLVEFESPFYGLDGSGPHESARVPEKFLELAPLDH